MKESNLLSGVFHSVENIPVIFSVDKDTYEFNFYTDSIYPHEANNGCVYLKAKDHYIFGRTHQGGNIAIYTGKNGVTVEGHQRVFTSTYIVSASCIKPSELSEFTGIRFVGGTLNDVFPTHSFRYCYNDDVFIPENNKRHIAYKITTKQHVMNWSIKMPDDNETGRDGMPIDERNVFVDILFDAPQPLSSFSLHYNKLKELLSFLTFRYNVGFQSIAFIAQDTDNNTLVKQADVYIQEETELTSKEYYHNITLHDLGDTLPVLIGLLYDTEDRKPSYSLTFYPSNDRELYRISRTRIREVCSAIECELGFLPELQQPCNELLNNLIDSTKSHIHSFRKVHDGLSNDTYNMIFSSIGNWSFTLAEKLIALFNLHKEEMKILNHFNRQISEKELRDFVKYRNHITHGTHRILDPGIAVVTHLLCGLVYCCVLRRIGLTPAKILELCQENKITT